MPNRDPISSSSKAFVLLKSGIICSQNLGVEGVVFSFLSSFSEWMNISAGRDACVQSSTGCRWDHIKRGARPFDTHLRRPPVGSKLRLILEATDDNCNLVRKRRGKSWQMDSFFRYFLESSQSQTTKKNLPYLGNWLYTKNSSLLFFVTWKCLDM